jgi:hypothetical protein
MELMTRRDFLGAAALAMLAGCCDSRENCRVQYVPALVPAAADLRRAPDETARENIQAANFNLFAAPKAQELRAVTWAGAAIGFVAVGAVDGTDAALYTSLSGENWVEQANPKNLNLNGIAWSGSLAAGVGAADGTDAYIITSSNGTSWTERANAKALQLLGVCFGNGLFVAVGAADTDAYILTSSDGTTWTERSNAKAIALNAVCWTGKSYIAVGDNDGSQPYILRSTDGTTWSQITGLPTATTPRLLDIAVGALTGRLVAVGFDASSNPLIYTSDDDGLTWTTRSVPVNRNPNTLLAVAAGDASFVVGGKFIGGGFGSYLLNSEDGANWRECFNPGLSDLQGLAWNGSRFVGVCGASGSNELILASLSK